MSGYIDISLPLSSQLPVWPGDPPLVVERFVFMDQGAAANVSRLSGTVHIGTHIDAPDHFLNDGRTVAQVDLDACLGPAWVLDLTQVAQIDRPALEAAWPEATVTRVLLKTRNSQWWAQGHTRFREDYVALLPDAAAFLVAQGVRLVGIDYLSIAPYADPTPTHRVLLQAGVVILEGLRLDRAVPGPYTLYCLPLNIPEAEGAPARAVLVPRANAPA